MHVTKIEPVTKTKYKVFLEGQFAFVLYKGELSRYHILEDSELEQEVIDKINTEVVLKRAKLRALHLLNDMDRTEMQLRTKLKQGMYTEDVIDKALEYVKSFGYIEDCGYARRFIAGRQNSKSRKEIYAALCQKGISRETIEAAMEECYEEKDEKEAILKLLEKKRFDPETADEAGKSKLYGYLMRKGFRYEDIRDCLSVK